MRTEQGFTLIEIMVAMVILSVALFELGRLQITALRATSNASRASQATSIAQDNVELVMALAYTAATLDDATPVGQFTIHANPKPPPPGYTVTWAVDKDNPQPNVKLVNVKVTRQNGGKTFVLSLRKALE